MWNMLKLISELHSIFHFLNEEIFKNELPEPAITIQSRGKRNALGWCSQNPIWLDNDEKDKRHEINICAENANMKVMDVLEIMLHEMVHYYGDLHEIKTTSRNGNFHNKKYKELAEKFGLLVIKTQKYGYSETKLNDKTLQLVKDKNFNKEAFLMYRTNDEGMISKKKGSIKHTCPDCGNVARSTKEMVLICGKCNSQMDNDCDEDD
jgi:ribosomal protein S27AE